MNKYKFNLNSKDIYLNIPIQIKTDLFGRDDLLDKYEEVVTEEVINPIEDFEVTRYAHKDWVYQGETKTSVEYKFMFFDRSVGVSSTTSSDTDLWVSDYDFTENPNFTGTSFNEAEIYYTANSFKRSFFKLDLYDTTDSETQQIYLTIIIPTQQGKVKLSSTTPFTGTSSSVSGPTIPVVLPDTPVGGGGRNSTTVSAAAKVYEDTLNKILTKNQTLTKNKQKMNPENRAYKAQLEYELSIQKRKAEETNQKTYKGLIIDKLVPGPDGFGDSGGGGGPLFPTSDDGTTPIEPDPPGEGGDVNPNPQGIGTGATPVLDIAPPNVDIKLPNFVLDYIGDKEGYFIYWLKNPTYVNIDTLYMSAKFFNAKTGQFIRMMNSPQSVLSEKFTFEKSKKFYYKVQLDIDNYEYEIKDTETDVRLGVGNPINWYEYVNPS